MNDTFQQIKPGEVEKLLAHCRNENEAVLRKPGSDVSISAMTKGFSKTSDGKFQITFMLKKSTKSVSKQSVDWLVSLLLPMESVFFKAKIDYEDDAKSECAVLVTGPVFKIQRRENFRLSLPDAPAVQLKFAFNDSTHTVQIANLSATGAAIYIKNAELSETLKKGAKIEGISFSAGGEAYKDLQGEVVHVLKAGKVGIKFNKLTAAQERTLTAFIFREVSKYFR